MNRIAAAGRAIGGGLLYGCAQVGIGMWPLAFACLALWWSALKEARPARGFGSGCVFGASAYLIAMAWLLPTASRFSGAGEGLSFVGLALWLAQGAWIAIGFGVAGMVSSALLRRGWPSAFAGPLALVLVEWVQPQVFGAGVGAVLATTPVLAQPAALGGPLLLTSFVAVTNGLILDAVRSAGRPRAGRALLAVLVVVGVAIGGSIRLASLDDGDSTTNPPLAIGLVQANVDPLASRMDAAPGHRAHLAASRRLLAEGPVDLLVWPEGAYARALPGVLPLDGQPIRADLGVPLLFGANRRTDDPARRGATNSAFLIGRDGRITQAYDKRRLVPLAETGPGEPFADWRREWMPHARSFVAGDAPTALTLGPHRIATPICYEVTHSEDVAELVTASNATVIVTLSDDGWFGVSREPAMHLALARLRAIEQGRWLVRAAVHGPSAVVDPGGRIVAQTPPFEAATLRATIFSRSDPTPYARGGDGLVLVGWLFTAGLLGVRRRTRT
ncbi:MAG: apolipoprotein N-acyltransferase [bacterium]|nr:apolipoprotein N-acyltransferase [bacterium]